MDPISISEGLNSNITAALEVVVLSLAGISAVGTLAMSIVQASKAFSFRDRFFRGYIRGFLRKRLGQNSGLYELEEWIYLLSAGGEKEFYTQDLDAIIDELGAIRNLAIAYPEKPENERFLNLFDSALVKIYNDKATPAADKKKIAAYLQKLITAHLDGLSTIIKKRWMFSLHCLAILVSTVIIILFAPIENPLLLAIYGVLGGFIAPFAHDLVKKLKPS